MSGSDIFIETLKRIGFPEAHKYKPDDFASLLADKDLGPILESFCTLTEDNVLTPEELTEYAAIPATELACLENLAQKSEAFTNDFSEEKSEEVKFLERQFNHIEEHNGLLNKQKDLLKLRLCGIVEEKEQNEKILDSSKRRFEILSMQKVPHAQEELINDLKTVSKLILEIKSLITDPDYDSEITSLNLNGAESYLEREEQLLHYIQDLLGKQFHITDLEDFRLNIPEHEDSKLLREVSFLQRVLKNSKFEEFKTLGEKEKLIQTINFYKKFESVLPSNIFEISTSELWSRLKEESDLNEKLIAKETLIHLYLSAAIAEKVDAQCNKVGLAHLAEVKEIYSSNCKKIQMPLEEVISHKCRLQLVALYFDAYAQQFIDIKKLTEKSCDFVKREQKILSLRKCNFQRNLEELIQEEDKYLKEDSIFSSIFKILKSINDVPTHISSVTMDDILRKVEKLHDQKDYLDKLENQKLTILDSLENQRSVVEKLVFQGKEHADLSEKNANVNVQLNKLEVTFLALKKTLLDVQEYMDTKEKLLKQDEKLRLARCLYLYALSNEKKFHFCIEKIKKAAANCAGSSSES